MGRWIPEECGKIVDETGAFLGRANSDGDAKNLCSDHATDCDTYEARIAELEEVAGKAEVAQAEAEHTLFLERKCHEDLRASHKLMVQYAVDSDAKIAELESALSSEVADNARLRAREVGDYAANLLQEIADKNNRIAEMELRLGRVSDIIAAVIDQNNAAYDISDLARCKAIAEGSES